MSASTAARSGDGGNAREVRRIAHHRPDLRSAIVGAAIERHSSAAAVAEMQFMDFISCAFDQITNFAAKCRYRWGPACRSSGAVGRGSTGAVPFPNPEMYFVHTPGLKVVQPATAYDAKGPRRRHRTTIP
jgi:2-oxoisovalerate dehydrogenase E1 component beta subunit